MMLVKKLWHENKVFFVFIVLMFMFRSAIADWNHVPSGSMLPTIQIGDRILVNKMAYDVRVPFTSVSLHRHADPVTGDIVIFESTAADKRLVKRVVAVPGDRVSMKNNKLKINGQELIYKDDESTSIFWEQLNSVADNTDEPKQRQVHNGHFHRIQLHGRSSLSNFTTVIVPTDQYLVLGDNRNNSADSRVIGFIPRNEIIGRTRSVVMSFNYDNYYLPRKNRFFELL